jgi:hypothetical protein
MASNFIYTNPTSPIATLIGGIIEENVRMDATAIVGGKWILAFCWSRIVYNIREFLQSVKYLSD